MGNERRLSRAERRGRAARDGGGQAGWARLVDAVGRQMRYVRTTLAGLLAAAAVAAFALVVAFAGPGRDTAANTAGSGTSGPQWIALPSTSPAAIEQAARASRVYQDVWNSPQTRAGQALRTGILGNPVLVHAYRPTPGMLDVWVIPVRSASAPGVTLGQASETRVVMLLDFAYDAAHRRMRPLTFAGPFVPGDPEYGRPFPHQTATQVLAIARTAKGAIAVLGAQAELVYFPANLDALNAPHPSVTWTGGGQFPDLAIWRILPAGGGTDYLVGLDGHIYQPSQLPLAPGAGA